MGAIFINTGNNISNSGKITITATIISIMITTRAGGTILIIETRAEMMTQNSNNNNNNGNINPEQQQY